MCTAVSCQKEGANGIYGVTQQSSGSIILYFAPSTPIGQPDAEKVILKKWDF